MKVLIVGGTGNISTPVTKALMGQGHEVTLFNRGHQPVDGARCLAGDRTRHAEFEATIAAEGTWDCVIDMIGYEPADAESVVRAFAGRTGQFIFCSTVDVYTKTTGIYPVREDAQRQPSPSFPYARKKAIMENTLLEAEARGAFPLTIIRPAATYNDGWAPIPLIGPGPSLLRRIREGKPVIVLGDGSSIWVSSHRDDVARAFVGAVGNSRAMGQAYTVSGDEMMTWGTYYQTAADVMGAPPIITVRVPTELLGQMAPRSAEWSVINFQYNNIFDNSAAKRDLGYQYTITWAEGLRRIVAHLDAAGEIANSPDVPLYDAIVSAYSRFSKAMVEELAGKDA